MDNYINKVIEQIQEDCESFANIEWVKRILTEMGQLSYEAGQKAQQAKVEGLQKRIDTALEKIDRFYKDGCLFHEWVYVAEQALKGEG